ncbi:MAG: hypothetical protein MI824_25880 [Hyphomicrobiales bacterium]|nr:hypothetical protein [Hyphomicrobiales bacterium]
MTLAVTEPPTATGHLGLAIGDVPSFFNVEARRHGAPERLMLQDGTCERGQRTVCTYTLSESVGVLISTDRDGASVTEFSVMFVGKDRDGFQDAVTTFAIAMALFDPRVTEDDRSHLVQRLLDGAAERDEFAVDGKAVRYKLLKTRALGLHLVIEPRA